MRIKKGPKNNQIHVSSSDKSFGYVSTTSDEIKFKAISEKTNSTEDTIFSASIGNNTNFLERFSSNNNQVEDYSRMTKISNKKQNAKKNSIFKSITCQLL